MSINCDSFFNFVKTNFLKDYYYFLGVRQDSGVEEIRRAYRKLSLKYHPDKNDGDEFFAERFREVQEAYDNLNDPERRRIFDQSFGQQKTSRNNLPPYIKNFSANKVRVKKGEEIILNWQTNNADLVKILPFGLEKTYGERKFRVTDFKKGQFHVVLQATNTLINQSVVQGITFTEIFENESEKLKNDVEELFKSQPRTPQNPYGRPKIFIWMAVVLLVFVILILLMN